MAVNDGQQPTTSSSAIAAMRALKPSRRAREEELHVSLIAASVSVATAHVNATMEEKRREQEQKELEARYRRANGILGRRFTYFLFSTSVLLPFFKIVGCLTVLFVDVEMDHICRVTACQTLVYSPKAAIYFLSCLAFLVVAIFHLYLGLNIFTRYPDRRCLVVIDNISYKSILVPMRFYSVATGVETFIICLAAFYTQPNPEIIFPCFAILAIEFASFMTVLCYTSVPQPRDQATVSVLDDSIAMTDQPTRAPSPKPVGSNSVAAATV